jgi:hypothetical protein
MSAGSIGSTTGTAALTQQLRQDRAKLAQDTQHKASAAVIKADQARVTKDQRAAAQGTESVAPKPGAATGSATYL